MEEGTILKEPGEKADYIFVVMNGEIEVYMYFTPILSSFFGRNKLHPGNPSLRTEDYQEIKGIKITGAKEKVVFYRMTTGWSGFVYSVFEENPMLFNVAVSKRATILIIKRSLIDGTKFIIYIYIYK